MSASGFDVVRFEPEITLVPTSDDLQAENSHSLHGCHRKVLCSGKKVEMDEETNLTKRLTSSRRILYQKRVNK